MERLGPLKLKGSLKDQFGNELTISVKGKAIEVKGAFTAVFILDGRHGYKERIHNFFKKYLPNTETINFYKADVDSSAFKLMKKIGVEGKTIIIKKNCYREHKRLVVVQELSVKKWDVRN